jgi:hypothetical protein
MIILIYRPIWFPWDYEGLLLLQEKPHYLHIVENLVYATPACRCLIYHEPPYARQ